ncbi:MAG: hypothetical protein IPM57_10945 [Oligoflexia bacterium]|nr:hypothetical protein [Oligoflexia bacterium]
MRLLQFLVHQLYGSNVLPNATAPTKIYYSSIDVATYTDADATTCSTSVNPNCKVKTSQLQLSVSSNNSSVTSATKVYLFVNTTTVTADPEASAALTGAGRITDTTLASPTLTTTFENICDTASQNAADDCTTDGLLRIHIIVDVNNDGLYTSGTDEIYSISLYLLSTIDQFSSSGGQTGFYSFVAFPGDEKIKLKNISVESSFPDIDNTNNTLEKIRVFYLQSTITNMEADVDGMDPTATTYSYIDIPITNKTISTTFVKPLTNLEGDNVYCFLTSLVDYAGNVGFLMAVADRGAGTSGFGDGMCAQPNPVAGLMSENGHCFIATAAFGSELSEQVIILRKFRDEFLLKTSWGQSFVHWYYANSPYYAEKIKQSPSAKKITQTLLWPLVGYSQLALKWGPYQASLFAVIILLFPILVIQNQILKRRRKT